MCVDIALNFKEDEPKQVTVRGEEVTLKSIMMEDPTGKIKVTLWRDNAKKEVRPGDHIRVTDVVINHFNGSTSLQTTMLSSVEVSKITTVPTMCINHF